jgi:putative N6-adenine-specific DNA methylase
MSERLFAVCAPGVEEVLAQELAGMGLAGEVQPGGVAFEGGISAIYRANLYARTASRVLLRLGEFFCAAFSELRKKAGRLPWEIYLKPERPVAVRVTCHKSKLYHSDAVAQRIAGAVEDRLKRPVQMVKFDEDGTLQAQLIVARLDHDLCTLSLDCSGEILHRRGYRLETAKAPLRETLAAALLLRVGYDGSQSLIDPFCGSGTIPIEAALIAARMAPGKSRRFAFMDWPGYDNRLWRALIGEAVAGEVAPGRPVIGSDRDEGAVRISQENAERAGTAGWLRFDRCAVSAIEPPPGAGWVITNPPYGLRISEGKDLRNLYAQLGHVLREKCTGWQVGFLCSDRALAGQTGINLEVGLRFANGGIPVGFYQGVIPPSGR